MHFSPEYLLPLVGAFIGWFTNYLAIKMLFHPRQPRFILGLRIQGVFPHRQAEFGRRLGELVSGELLSIQDLTARLRSKAGSGVTTEHVISKIEQMILNRLGAEFPILSSLIGRRHIQKVTSRFHGDLRRLIAELVEHLSLDLERELDVKELVTEKVRAFPVARFESLVLSIMRRELRSVEVTGGVLGFAIGAIQLGLESFL